MELVDQEQDLNSKRTEPPQTSSAYTPGVKCAHQKEKEIETQSTQSDLTTNTTVPTSPKCKPSTLTLSPTLNEELSRTPIDLTSKSETQVTSTQTNSVSSEKAEQSQSQKPELASPPKSLKQLKTPHQGFYKPSEFPQLKLLDANYKSIKAELFAILDAEAEIQAQSQAGDLSHPPPTPFFEPWIEKDLYEESNPEGWLIAPLMIGGKRIERNCKKASFLFGLLLQIPQIVSASFSLLKPNTHIVPHKGYDEYSEEIFRYHLGLVVPKGDLGLRVNTEIKVWKEGESFVFDDYQIHEAWNFTNENRFVLICDFYGSEEDLLEKISKLGSLGEGYFEGADQGSGLGSKEVVFSDKKFKDSISSYV